MEQEYYLGVDMGTSSVGWAATTPDYNLVRAKGKDLWGVRLFDEAKTAAERRMNRTSRRRRQREVARLGFLKMIFEKEINKIDPNFFMRLRESKYHKEDRSANNQQKYALFADENYTDKEYFAEYPTIFHLRKDLIETNGDKQFDVRLVYLAIASLYKRRGHFLNDSMDESDTEHSISELYQELTEKMLQMNIDMPKIENVNTFEEILGQKGRSKSSILEEIVKLLSISKKEKVIYSTFELICGKTVKLLNFSQIFDIENCEDEEKKLAICFRAESYNELATKVQSIIGSDNFEVFELMKEIHDKGLISNIMNGWDYLSQARVASYKAHEEDLKLLKKVLKRYDINAYNQMFRIMKEGNYSAYVGSVNSLGEKIRRNNYKQGRSIDALKKSIENILKKFPQDDDVLKIIDKLDSESFLPKQLTFENGVIPNQIHLREMRKILNNAMKYLPFLSEKDETGLTNADKIVEVFKFRVPYYVGPVGNVNAGNLGVNAWSKRIGIGKVYPWNFNEMINLKSSRLEFIERMVRHCTYLSGERALPKCSYLYEKFQVLNELNNLKINGVKIAVETKQNIYKDLFSKGKKVSLTTLRDYLEKNNYIEKGESEVISGIDGGFKSSLTTVGKFYGIFGEEVHSDEKRKIIEDIVFWGTVFGKEKRLLIDSINEKYPEYFTEKELQRISSFKFDGWGRLSKSFFLVEGRSIQDVEGRSIQDGVIRSVINALWETNDNLMELFSSKYTYTDSLKEMVNIVVKPLSEWTFDDLNGMYLSAPVKRMVWQTLSIVKEVEETIGKAPAKIFVEVTREDGEKKRTISRKQKLIDLYKTIGKEAADWRKEIENRPESDFNSKKLYLYYTQMGRCMYTGKEIDLDKLMMANSDYDIDHIYPRHFIKDDSIENNLVLVDKRSNAYKSDNYPIVEETRNNMMIINHWKLLRSKGFISAEKFNRLVRNTKFTAEEKTNFINRQLVETSQGIKAITQIFSNAFPKSEIVFSKASTVSDFRQKYKLFKVRAVNNLHHAHDAYLNIVVGNIYFVKFTRNPANFIKEAEKNQNKAEYHYNMDKMFSWDVVRNEEVAWIAESEKGPGTIKTIKKVLRKGSPLVTKKCMEYHGGITKKSTIWSHKVAKVGAYMPIKTSDVKLRDVTRYGGISDIATSGYSLVSYELNGVEVRSLEQLPVYLGRVKEVDNESLKKYFEKSIIEANNKKVVSNVRVCRKFIPLNSVIRYNGFYYYIGGKSNSTIGVTSALELFLTQEQMYYFKKIEKAILLSNFEKRDEDNQLVISKDKNMAIYNLIKKKLSESIYKNQIGPVKTIIYNGEEQFKNLNIEKQCFVLMQLLLHLSEGKQCNLYDIGGSDRSGSLTISKDISKAKECVLIAQSPSGIYRAEIDLLKE